MFLTNTYLLELRLLGKLLPDNTVYYKFEYFESEVHSFCSNKTRQQNIAVDDLN